MGSGQVACQPSQMPMSAMGLAIRPAQPGEGSTLTDLCIRSKAHWGYDARFMAVASRLLRIGEGEIAAGCVLVAVAAAEVRGVVAIEPLRRPHWFEISHLFVAPECFGRGIGRALFDAAVALAAERGAAHVSILSDPHAAAFYGKLGARRCGAAPSGVAPGRMLPLFEVAVARRAAAD